MIVTGLGTVATLYWNHNRKRRKEIRDLVTGIRSDLRNIFNKIRETLNYYERNGKLNFDIYNVKPEIYECTFYINHKDKLGILPGNVLNTIRDIISFLNDYRKQINDFNEELQSFKSDDYEPDDYEFYIKLLMTIAIKIQVADISLYKHSDKSLALIPPSWRTQDIVEIVEEKVSKSQNAIKKY